MAQKISLDNLRSALVKNNEKIINHVDTLISNSGGGNNTVSGTNSNFVLIDQYDPLKGITTNDLVYYLDTLSYVKSDDYGDNILRNVINENEYFNNNTGCLINRKKVNFNGANNSLYNTTPINITYPFTLEFLVQVSSDGVLLTNSNPAFCIGINKNKILYSTSGVKNYNYKCDWSKISSTPTLITVCVNSDAVNDFKIYENGVELSSDTTTLEAWSQESFTGSYIGKLNVSSSPYYLNGDIYRMRIYDRILTQEEVKANTTADMEFIKYDIKHANLFDVNILDYVNTNAGCIEDLPIGTITKFAGKYEHPHYLCCDGSIYNIADYPDLVIYIQNTFGAINYFGGDGVETFSLPNIPPTITGNTNTLVPELTASSDKVITSSDHTSSPAYSVFNKTTISPNFWESQSLNTNQYVGYNFEQETTVGSYSITPANHNNNDLLGTPNNWIFQGSNDGSTWDDLDTRTNIVFTSKTDTKHFNLDKIANYSMYRLYCGTNNGYASDKYYIRIGNFGIYGLNIEMNNYIKYEPTYYTHLDTYSADREEVVLWEGSKKTTGSITLADSVDNYDEIMLTACFVQPSTGMAFHLSSLNVLKKDYYFVNNGSNESHCLNIYSYGTEIRKIGFSLNKNILTIGGKINNTALKSVVGFKYKKNQDEQQYTDQEVIDGINNILNGGE